MSSPYLLLVDDDPEISAIVGVLARKAGQSLLRCRDVASAWEALRQAEPDLILLDVNLPGESGLTLLARLRAADGYLAELRVALFCQSGLGRDVAAGWASGADYLVPKDLVCDPAGWSRRVGEILGHAGGQARFDSLGLLREVREPIDWVEAVRRAADIPDLRRLGAEVVDQLLRRALAHAFGRFASDWWKAVSGGIAPVGPFCTATPEQVKRVLTSFVEQVWCLLGSRACQACADRLRAAPGAGG